MPTMTGRYEAIQRYVNETPWAILPAALAQIVEIVSMRAAGERLSRDEIDERIGAARARQTPPPAPPASVAVIPIQGVIVPHADLMTDISGGTSIDGFVGDLRAAMADPAVSAIVLNVDSPGGSVELLAEAAKEIRRARSRKQIVGVANAFAASAAYYLLSQAGEVVVTPSGQVGSVGCIAVHQSIGRALELAGVDTTVVTYGAHKGEQNPFQPLSDEALVQLEQLVASYGQEFVADVARGRGVPAATVEADFGQGRMKRASDALRAGMVDTVQSLDDVLARLAGGVAPGGRAKARASAIDEALSITAEGPPAAVSAGPIPPHNTEVVDVPWNGPAEEARLPNPVGEARALKMYAWQDPQADPDTKTAYKFPHHEVDTAGEPGPAVLAGCEAGIGRISQANIPPADDAGVRAHLQRHIDHFNQQGASPGMSAEADPAQKRKESKMESTQTKPRTREEIAARMDWVRARQAELDQEYAGRQFAQEAEAEFEELEAEWHELEQTTKQLDLRARALERKASEGSTLSGDGAAPAGGIFRTNADTNKQIPDNPFDLAAYRGYAKDIDALPRLWQEGARRVNASLVYETEHPEKTKARVELLLSRDPSKAEPSESFAHRLLTTGNPAYDQAFGKLVMGRQLTSQEEQLVRAAVSNTGLGTETPVPVTIDPTVMLVTDGVVNPLRSLARVVTITGLKWRGITSDGVDVAYEAELSQVGDQTPTVGAPEAEVAKLHGYVEFSDEIDQDWPALRAELVSEFADAKDAKEADKFLNGDGSDEPEGLLYALEGGASEVFTLAQSTFAIEDLYAMKTALPPRFRGRASWLANDAIYSAVRAFGDASANTFWVDLAGDTPARLLGKPTFEASEMFDDPTNDGDPILLYGDFSRGFVIVDRIGMNVAFNPMVLGANQRPKGARALYVIWRNTSKLLVENAFRVLVVATS